MRVTNCLPCLFTNPTELQRPINSPSLTLSVKNSAGEEEELQPEVPVEENTTFYRVIFKTMIALAEKGLTISAEAFFTLGFLLKIILSLDVCDKNDEQSTCQDWVLYSLMALFPLLLPIHTLVFDRIQLSKRNLPAITRSNLPVLAAGAVSIIGLGWAAVHEIWEYISVTQFKTSPQGNKTLLGFSAGLAVIMSLHRIAFLLGEASKSQGESQNQELSGISRIKEWFRQLPWPDSVRYRFLLSLITLPLIAESLLSIEGFFDPIETYNENEGEVIPSTLKTCISASAVLINLLLELNVTVNNLKNLELLNYNEVVVPGITSLRIETSAITNALPAVAGAAEVLSSAGASKLAIALASLPMLGIAYQNEKAILLELIIEKARKAANSKMPEGYGTFNLESASTKADDTPGDGTETRLFLG